MKNIKEYINESSNILLNSMYTDKDWNKFVEWCKNNLMSSGIDHSEMDDKTANQCATDIYVYLQEKQNKNKPKITENNISSAIDNLGNWSYKIKESLTSQEKDRYINTLKNEFKGKLDINILKKEFDTEKTVIYPGDSFSVSSEGNYGINKDKRNIINTVKRIGKQYVINPEVIEVKYNSIIFKF